MKLPQFSKDQILSAVQKISITFCDDIGNPPTIISGTGFWLITQNHIYFVTNRHNVDPSMHNKHYALSTISISLRSYDFNVYLPSGGIKTLELSSGNIKIHWPSDKSDVVLIQTENILVPTSPTHKIIGIAQGMITNGREPEIFDNLYFVGFPGKVRANAAYNLPIARSCSLASLPTIDYSEEDNTIQSSETCLVDGLSFSGSSGSPVIRINGTEVRLVGIMSGHFNEVEPTSVHHSGLSYFTKASSILKIIENNKL